MPKRSKRQAQTNEGHEGRPPSLTLASFVKFPDLPASSNASSRKSADSERRNTCNSGLPSSKEDSCCSVDNNKSLSPETSVDIGTKVLPSSSPTYFIGKTKKGKLPLSCESRAKGKKVTVISNVSGDASGLLSELKRRAGCGGVIREDTVELQGDREKFLTLFLTGHSCLKPYKS